MFGVAEAQNSGDARAKVSSLCGETVVAQLFHQFHPQLGGAEVVFQQYDSQSNPFRMVSTLVR